MSTEPGARPERGSSRPVSRVVPSCRSGLLPSEMRLLASIHCLKVAVLFSLVASLFASVPASANPRTDEGTSDTMDVEGQLPLFEPVSSHVAGNHKADGWLIVNSRTRRGYQVFRLNSEGRRSTVVWSFHLDSLQPLRRGVIDNFEVIATGTPQAQGDIVHAVDEKGGRIFLAGTTGQFPSEMQVAVIDEWQLDDGPPPPDSVQEAGFILRRLRIPDNQLAHIMTTFPGFAFPSVGGTVRGMAFSRIGGPKLVLLFGTVESNPQINNHFLAQWDSELSDGNHGDWIVRLTACERSVLVSFQGWKYQLEILRGRTAISIGCQSSSGAAQAVRFPLVKGDGTPDPTGSPREDLFETFPIPRTISNVLADQKSERLLFEVQLNGTSWWAFDAKSGSWVGSAGETLWSGFEPGAGLDPDSGRLYALVPDHFRPTSSPFPVQGGFVFTESRLTPLPQFTNAIPSLAYYGQYRIWVDSVAGDGFRRVFVRRGNQINRRGSVYPGTANSRETPLEELYTIVEDFVPPAVQPSIGELDENTTNVPEEAGITGAKFDTYGSGFGFRSLLIGGFERLVEPGVLGGGCYATDRETIVGRVDGARLSNLFASAASISLGVDGATKADFESPSGRCTPLLGGFVPTSTSQTIDQAAGQKWDSNADGRDDYTAECTGDEGRVNAPTPQKVGAAYSTWAECHHSQDSVKGFSSGRFTAGGDGPPVSVMHATSSVTARRLQGGGTVVEVEAIARGIEIAGIGTIGLVRTIGVARSAGRPKTAEASFDRSICAVDIPGFQTTHCLTEEQQTEFVIRLNQLLVRMNGKARLRNPDPELLKGSDGGYLAAIQRDRREALDDKMVTRDASETVPGLEIIFYRGDSPTKGSGRQVVQFAAVQASSAYGIFCLFGKVPNSEEEEPSCVRPTSELKVQLTDDFEQNPRPLAGGVFQIHIDEDEDGILGVNDAVLELGETEAVCTTLDDGVGDCLFELQPGRYIVHQVKAPDGFTPSPDCAVFLPAFTSTTCEFVNSPNIGLIYIGLTDDSPEANPLSGGVFELYMDDGDQKLGTGDTKLASCTTDVFGDCVYRLPEIIGKAILIFCAGSPIESEELQEFIQMECIFDPDQGGNILAIELGTFIVHQTAAPPDYSLAEDQVLPLSNPWDVGIASFVNGLAPVEGTPPIEATPTRQSTVVIEEGSAPRSPVKQSTPRKEPQSPKIITRIVMAPSEAIGFLLRHPKQAAMFASIWLLLTAPLWLAWRRRSISFLKGAV